jgi:hypothetical protein
LGRECCAQKAELLLVLHKLALQEKNKEGKKIRILPRKRKLLLVLHKLA